MFRLKEKLFLLFSLFFLMLFIFSCSSSPPLSNDDDDTPQPDPVTVYGSWMSGEVLYHPYDSGSDTPGCLDAGLTLSEFSNVVIESNIQLEAYDYAEGKCDNEQYLDYGDQFNSEEECLLYFEELEIQELTEDLSTNDIEEYEARISHRYDYDELDLSLTQSENGEQNTYIVSYEGQCIDANPEFSEAGCGLLPETDAYWNGSECVFLTYTSCEEVGEGEWDEAFTGLWYSVGSTEDLYVLDDFFGIQDNDLTLTFNLEEETISISIESNEDQCICGDEYSVTFEDYTAEACVNLNCAWVEQHCVSLNFSK